MEDRPRLAAFLMVGGLFLLGLQDSFVKLVSADVSLWQFQFFRSSINLVMLLFLARILWKTARPRVFSFWAVALRSLLLAGAMILFFGGIPFLTLSEIAAGLYVFPFFLILLSRLVLGERVGLERVFAIILGFSGTLFILKPGTESFTPFGLLPICAAVCYAGTILTTRKLCRQESPLTLAFGVAIVFMTFGFVGMVIFSGNAFASQAKSWPYFFTGWSSLEWSVLGIIALCSCLNLTANISLSKAYQSAESTWLAPFDYSYLIFATFWGAVMWNDIPDVYSFLGMFLIAASGIFIAWWERKEKRKIA